MPTLNYHEILDETDASRRVDLAHGQLNSFPLDGPPSLSDLYANVNRGGQSFLIALAEREDRELKSGIEPFKWRIQVRCDEWGEKLGPGDVVVRETPINQKNRKGQPTRSGEINAAKVDGSYAERFVARREYVIDPRGCITCSFSDAGYFLQNWGVHFRSGRGMCGKPELSSEPCKTPAGGEKHVHYWRYAEVSKEDYEKLAAPTRRKKGLDEAQ